VSFKRTAYAALTVAVLAAGVLCARAAERDSSVEYFDGGVLRSEVRLSLGFLYGAGSRPDGLGSPVSTVRSGIASTSGNPSGLAFVHKGGVLLDVLPPLGASVSDIADLDARARSLVDDALEDVAAYGMLPTYPEVEALAGQQAGLVSGALVLRLGRVVGGVSVEEPMSLELELVENGIEAFAGGVKTDGGDNVDVEMRGFADAACDLAFRVDRTTAALAGRLAPDVGLGFSLSRYHATAGVDGVLRGDGVVDYGGQEYSFNDESDPWQNELGGSMTGAFDGDGLGWSAGASYRGFGQVTLDVQYVSVPRLELGGSVTTVESLPEAVSEDGIDLSDISASQPTLTETTVERSDDPVTLELPSYAGASATLRWGRTLTTLEYRLFSGDLGFEYEDYSERVNLRYGVGLELDLGGLWLGGGVLSGRLESGTEDDRETDDVLIPLANLGMGMEFGDSVGVDLLILALPMQVAKVSLSYGF